MESMRKKAMSDGYSSVVTGIAAANRISKRQSCELCPDPPSRPCSSFGDVLNTTSDTTRSLSHCVYSPSSINQRYQRIFALSLTHSTTPSLARVCLSISTHSVISLWYSVTHTYAICHSHTRLLSLMHAHLVSLLGRHQHGEGLVELPILQEEVSASRQQGGV